MASGSTTVNACVTSGGTVADVLRFTWQENSQSVADNATTIGWVLELISYEYGKISSTANKDWSVTVDGQNYSGTNKIGIPNNSTKVLASGTTVIKHDNDGTKFFSYSFSQEIEITFSGAHVGTRTGSGNGYLTAIPRASRPTLSKSAALLGDKVVIYTNRVLSSFTHKIGYQIGSASGTIGVSITDYTEWTIPKELVYAITNDSKGTCRIIVETFDAGTRIGDPVGVDLVINVPDTEEYHPSCSCTLADSTEIYGIYDSFVRGLSRIKFSVEATTAYGSPIKSYSVLIDGRVYSTASGITDVLKGAETLPVEVTVIDGRGRDGKWTGEISVLDYHAPIITKLAVSRCDSDGKTNKRGAYFKIVFSADITPLGEKNTANYAVMYKKTKVSDYDADILPITDYAPVNETYIFEASSDPYDIVLAVWDQHNSSNPITKSAKGPAASSIFSVRGFRNSAGEIEDGLGIGKAPDKPNTFQVGWDTKFDKPVSGMVWGLSTLELIPDGSDFDDYLTAGAYTVQDSTHALTMLNMPPDVTAGRLIVADSNGLDATGVWRYKEQVFIPFNRGAGITRTWMRHIYMSGTEKWIYTPWVTEALQAYPINSIYISYSHTSPADLFGGTWERIENTFLWALSDGGMIGLVGKLSATTEGDGAAYIQVSVWRRTA
ncbi:MAG: hypothetical protein IJY94_00460 [Clostridia bacterium]|nr:hypothetical protein [Clostridia bacterium]